MCQANCEFYGHKFGDVVTWNSGALTCRFCGCNTVHFSAGTGVYVLDEDIGHRVEVKSEKSVCPGCSEEHEVLVFICGDGIPAQLPVSEMVEKHETSIA